MNSNNNKNIQSITFKVSNVEKKPIENRHLKDIDIEEIVYPNVDLYDNSNKYIKKKILKSSFNDKESKNIGINSFIVGAINAYSNHQEFVIRPDDIWYLIVNQFSVYINQHSETLRNKFVSFGPNEKKKITVTTDYQIESAPFDKLIKSIINEIEKNLIDSSIVDWLIPNFTTTTSIDKLVFSSTVMSTLKNYFNYEITMFCGVPQITLFGSTDDWIDIKNRIERLKQYNIESDGRMIEWVNMLHPIIDQFISTVGKGGDLDSIDRNWWNQIIDYRQSSGSSTITGWLTVFTIFNKRGEWQGNKKHMLNGKPLSPWLIIPFNDIPSGYSSVPIQLSNNSSNGGQSINSDLYSGHMAIKLKDNDPTTIIPSLDWCLVVDR